MKKLLLNPKTLSQFFYSLTFILLCANVGWGQTSFTTSGVWKCPDGVTSVQVEAWGGGGGGAGAGSSANLYSGGGGAGGNYARNTSVTVSPGTQYIITVGAGGVAGGNSGTASDITTSNGGTSSFGTLLFASGGQGGIGGLTAIKKGVGGGNGGILSYTFTPGSGYSSSPSVKVGTAWSASATYTINQQYFNEGKLYTVTTAGTSGTSAPTHTSGALTATDGTAIFTYAGIAATAVASTTGTTPNKTVSGVLPVIAGSGYLSAPTVTIDGNATVTAAAPSIINVNGSTFYALGGLGGNGTYYGSFSYGNSETFNRAGGGGASGGPLGFGNNGSGTTGGAAVTGSGAGANALNTNGSLGIAATEFGGGGSGGVSISNSISSTGVPATQVVGGAGAAGKIVITYPIVSSTGSLLAFTTAQGNVSAAQSIDISGLNLTEGIKVKPPTGFEVSTSSNFITIGTNANPITVGFSGTVNSTTVYVRMQSTTTVASSPYAGSISLLSNNATTVTVTIPSSTVTLTAAPKVNLNATSLTSFEKTTAGKNSAVSQNFIVNGVNLGANTITITPPTHFKISKTDVDANYSTSAIVLSPSNGTVETTVIYVKYCPTGTGNLQGNSDSIRVTNASVSAQNVTVSGSGLSTFYYNSGGFATLASWKALSDGSGDSPADFTTTGISYKILKNATTSSAAWTLSATDSKIVVGDPLVAGVTLTIASTYGITGTIDATAASSGSNSIVIQEATTQPTFGILDASSEVHYSSTITVANSSTTFGKLFIDGGTGTTFTLSAGTPTIQTSLTVTAGSTMSPSGNSTVWFVINDGATVTIDGTFRAGKSNGFSSFGVPTASANYGTLQFKSPSPASLVLGSSSTIEYDRSSTTGSQLISARTDYANLTISDGANALVPTKSIVGAVTVSGVLTLNQSGGTIFDTAGKLLTVNGNLVLTAGTLKGSDKVTLGNGATIVKTEGSFDVAPTFGSTLNVTYKGKGSKTINCEIKSESTLVILSQANASIIAGSAVSGTGIPLGTTVSSISGTSITLSNSATENGTSVALKFDNSLSQTPGFEMPANGSVLNNLTIDNTAGLILNANTTINGTLTLTSGNITTGSNSLIIGVTGLAISRTKGHIVGNLKKLTAASASPSFKYEIGDAKNYTPVNLTFEGTTSAAGGITASTAGVVLAVTGSGIVDTKDVNRTWTLTNDGIAGFTNYGAAFTYASADNDPSTTAAIYKIHLNNSGSWSQLTNAGVPTSTSAAATGITSFGSFRIGESDGTLGLSSQVASKSKCTVYPNPVKDGKLYISSSNASEKQVSIYSILGQKVIDVKTNNNTSEINVSKLSKGNYILRITEDGKSEAKKLIIQ